MSSRWSKSYLSNDQGDVFHLFTDADDDNPQQVYLEIKGSEIEYTAKRELCVKLPKWLSDELLQRIEA